MLRMWLVTALFGSITISACTGSPATLAIPPDFELQTPAGIAGVSIRESPSGMTDAEFKELVAHEMAFSMPGNLVSGPAGPPFPTRRIVWHVYSVGRQGVERLAVNVFDGSDAFADEEQAVDKSAPRVVIESAITSLTRRLTKAMDKHDLRASASRR